MRLSVDLIGHTQILLGQNSLDLTVIHERKLENDQMRKQLQDDESEEPDLQGNQRYWQTFFILWGVLFMDLSVLDRPWWSPGEVDNLLDDVLL